MKKINRIKGVYVPFGSLGQLPVRNPRVRLLIQVLGYMLLACIAGSLTYAAFSWYSAGGQVPK